MTRATVFAILVAVVGLETGTISVDAYRATHQVTDSQNSKLRATRDADLLYINEKQSLPETARVLIVGAGPSGVHMAAMLKKKGYHDLTILEKTDRVGGKSYTVWLDEQGNDCSQRPMFANGTTDWSQPVDRQCNALEMGTIFLHNGYHRVRNLNAEYGLTPEEAPVKGPATVVGADQSQAIMSTLFASEGEMPGVGSMGDYIVRLLKEVYPSKMPDPHNVRALTKFFAVVQRYNQVHYKLLKYDDPGYTFPRRPSDEDLSDLSLTFERFLQKHDLMALSSVLAIAQAAQGYGYINDVSAYYGLMWITPEVMCGFAQQAMLQQMHLNKNMHGLWGGAGDVATKLFQAGAAAMDALNGRWPTSCPDWTMKVSEITTMLPEGYGALFKKIYETDLQGKVEFLVGDLQIDRRVGTDEPIKVTYSVPSSGGVESKEHEFDFMVYTGPTRAAHKYVTDLTDFEQSLFSEHWEGATLVTTSYRAPPIPGVSDEHANFAIMYYPDNVASEEFNGHWYADKNTHIFSEKNDFSESQLRSAIQYYNYDVGTVDRQPPSQFLHAANKDPAGDARRQALAKDFSNLGASDSHIHDEVHSKLEETLEPAIPGGISAVDFLDRKYDYAWPYFSRFDQQGVRRGKPWDLEEAQGDPQKMPKTWFVGGSVVFESVNDVLAYNLRLLRRHSQWTEPFEAKTAVYHKTNQHKRCKQLWKWSSSALRTICPEHSTMHRI